MNNNKDLLEDNYNESFEDIELMLRPRCEFKASENLKKEVMERARKEIYSHHTVKMWPWLVAACVAGLIIMFLMPPKISLKQTPEKNQIVAIVETRKPAERKQKERTPDQKNISDEKTTKAVEEKVAEDSPNQKNVSVNTPKPLHSVLVSYSPPRGEIAAQSPILKVKETSKRVYQKSKEDMQRSQQQEETLVLSHQPRQNNRRKYSNVVKPQEDNIKYMTDEMVDQLLARNHQARTQQLPTDYQEVENEIKIRGEQLTNDLLAFATNN